MLLFGSRKTVLLVGLGFLIGCGGSDANRVPTHAVTGTVTMAGGPLAGASVTFSPKEGQPVATARTNAEGKYSLTTYDAGDGAAAGSYVVLVTKHTAIAEAGPPSHDAFASGNSKTVIGHSAKKKGDEGDAVPPRYASPASSDLSANVKAGETNVIDLTVNP